MALSSTVNQEEHFFIADLAGITLINGLVARNLQFLWQMTSFSMPWPPL
jgi:hypothetical protein